MQKQLYQLIFIKIHLRCYNCQSCGHYREAKPIQMQEKFVFANTTVLFIVQQLNMWLERFCLQVRIYHLLSFA